MESLDEVSGELVTLLNFHLEGAEETEDPEQQVADADSACVYYQAVGICELLLDAEVDAFFHHLIRSAQTRLWVLEHGTQLEQPPRKLLKTSNARGLHAALAARQWELARRIARASPTTWMEGVEYEDDFLAVHFVHRHLLGAPPEELRALLDRFETVLEGGPSPRFDLCRHLLARDIPGCTQAFADLLDERTAKLKKMKRESVAASDELFVPQSAIYMEGLAWLALLEQAGIPTEPEYPMCPSLARQSKYAPFEVSTFPSVPL
ncbi:immunity 49 family protein [Pyxidicoccus parkwayensis]|uniref:Immunity 49 family protein n=1 Tax=Pyxidicoccus parkwayensis TaxID=2813578 RepID=A0ABX7NSX3_9BACT|nr:Imm49 family immunity protein [Pyxidicoccus parkwaysis]QSQ21986.1 immunity 49 family protein [Pyxidicoccus parkwaysis]